MKKREKEFIEFYFLFKKILREYLNLYLGLKNLSKEKSEELLQKIKDYEKEKCELLLTKESLLENFGIDNFFTDFDNFFEFIGNSNKIYRLEKEVKEILKKYNHIHTVSFFNFNEKKLDKFCKKIHDFENRVINLFDV